MKSCGWKTSTFTPNLLFIQMSNTSGVAIFCETRTRPWLLKPWLLKSPGHQQPMALYWLYMVERTLFFMRQDLNYQCHFIVVDRKCVYICALSERFHMTRLMDDAHNKKVLKLNVTDHHLCGNHPDQLLHTDSVMWSGFSCAFLIMEY